MDFFNFGKAKPIHHPPKPLNTGGYGFSASRRKDKPLDVCGEGLNNVMIDIVFILKKEW
jgi:hypothetical protein